MSQHRRIEDVFRFYRQWMMEDPHAFNEEIALLLASSADVYARLEALNQKLLKTLETISDQAASLEDAAQQNCLSADKDDLNRAVDVYPSQNGTHLLHPQSEMEHINNY